MKHSNATYKTNMDSEESVKNAREHVVLVDVRIFPCPTPFPTDHRNDHNPIFFHKKPNLKSPLESHRIMPKKSSGVQAETGHSRGGNSKHPSRDHQLSQQCTRINPPNVTRYLQGSAPTGDPPTSRK